MSNIVFINESAIKANTRVKIATHSGIFHADDVVAIAMASYLYGEVVVDRVNMIDVEKAIRDDLYDFVIDVGRRYDEIICFDHHQDISPDDDSVLPCGASLYIKAELTSNFFKEDFANSEQLYKALYERILRPICVQDNGQSELVAKYPNTAFGWIRYMNPTWDSNESSDKAFERAVNTAIPILKAVIKKIEAESTAADLVKNAPTLEDGAIVVLSRYVPWQDIIIAKEESRFVIFPSNRGGYMLNAVPPSKEDMFNQRIPIRWENMPEGCSFVHKACFCASFDTEEHAIAAAKSLL